MRHTILCVLALGTTTVMASAARPQTTAEAFAKMQWDDAHSGEELSLADHHLTFEDEFHVLSVTAEPGKGLWFAPVHTPWGAGTMRSPGPDGPFSVADGKLTITGRKDAKGEWTSDTMQTVDGKGRGFAQQYGYFEMCAEFLPGPGAWPTFWLKAQKGDMDAAITRSEIDVIEWYGSDPTHLHNGIHLWPGRPPKPGALTKPIWKSEITAAPLKDGELSGYHTYGVMITPEWIIMYYDRKELARFPTLPEHRTPRYMLVSLPIEPNQPTATSPKIMKVDYVRAYGSARGARHLSAERDPR